MKKPDIESFFARLEARDPAPRSDLDYRNPFTLLVAVVLSAQATDIGVNKATGPLYAVADTPQAMVALGEDALRGYIRTIGLFNTKARNIIALSRLLIDQHGGEVPADREGLEALPGVGRKTASVVLNAAFGESTIAVDTHVFRVANRSGLASAKTANAVEEKLVRLVPEAWRRHAHHWLILHGRYVCTARKPRCAECRVNDLCAFKGKSD